MSDSVESGYESDTGPRDNPTCWHFENNRPVTKSIEVKRGYHVRLLNHEGRSICRIMKEHGWSATHLGTIFGLRVNAINRALDNTYTPADDLSKDYDHVDPEYKIKFPPRKRIVHPALPPPVIEILDSDEEDTKVGILASVTSNSAAGMSVRKPPASAGPSKPAKTEFWDPMQNSDEEQDSQDRHNQISEPARLTTDVPAATVETRPSPLPGSKNVLPPRNTNIFANVSPPPPRPSAQARSPASKTKPAAVSPAATFQQDTSSAGMKRAHDDELARHSPRSPIRSPELIHAVPVTKKPRPEDSVSVSTSSYRGAQSATPLTSISQSRSPGPRTSALPSPFQAHPASAPLPLPRRAAVPPTALDVFLSDVAGADLSAHRALFLAQGFDMRMLRVVARWSRADRERAVRELMLDGAVELKGRRGLSPLQVMGLAMAIQRLEAGGDEQ
ncbi:hypothetical protein B0H15DRAFT_831868 [Mycena belliarum]|uniref:Uncharacterized protein n=1 Tax=Mycena belliarum TaxID=1033014 RepID=A0AAD6U8K5_9AGAR|nr:hypothetical protein B0H15DRAFT_831868 [Mycena belliae]